MYNNGKVGKDCFRRWDKRQSAGKERLLILKSLPSLGGGGGGALGLIAWPM